MDSKNTGGSRPLRVAIIGGGIGGVLLAIGLQKHEHIDYQLYEAATSFGEIGLGVAIGPNAQHALELIDPRARAVLDKLGSTNLWESHLLDFVVYKSVCREFSVFWFKSSKSTDPFRHTAPAPARRYARRKPKHLFALCTARVSWRV